MKKITLLSILIAAALPAFADDTKLEGKCGRCEFKRVCLGCRARAYYESHGNYMAEEPYCIYEPKRMQPPADMEIV